jgi:hypothetical protein
MARHPHLDTLIGAYFHQDASYVADTLEGLVADFVDGHRPEQCAALRADIAAFMDEHAGHLNAAFEAAYGADVDSVLWDHADAASFLRAVVAVLPA